MGLLDLRLGNVDFSWLQGLLQLLFGQLGAVGTILVGACSYIAWLYKNERDSHDKTRKEMQDAHEETRKQMHELSEKRFSVILETFKIIEGFKKEIEELSVELRRVK